MNLAAAVAKNTIIQITGKVVSTILGIFSLALMTRYLGQAGFGEYTTIITFLTFFAIIADLGITLVTTQMISGEKDKAKENKILNNLFSLRLISILIFLGLAVLSVMFFPYGLAVKYGVLIAAVSFIFPALNQVLIGLFQKKLSMDRVAIAEIAGRIVLIIGVILAITFNAGLNGILFATIASAIINFLLHFVFSRQFVIIRLEFDFSLWKKIFIKSWPLAITIVLNLIYLRADILILSLFRGPNEVGLYGAAYRIIDVLATIPFMFAGIVLPILTVAWLENNPEYFKKVLQKSFDFMAIVAIPLVIGAQFLADPVMSLIAGPDFIASGLILKVLIFSVAAIFLGTIFSHAVIAMDKQREIIRFYVFTSITALIAYFFLIPRYSYFGAAGVTIYSEVLIAIFCIYCVFKNSRFLPSLRVGLKSLAASGIMALSIYIFPLRYQGTLGGLVLIVILATLIYFLCLYSIGGIKSTDLKMIINRKDKDGNRPTYEPGTNF